MSDALETARRRLAAFNGESDLKVGPHGLASALEDAADEIERLRVVERHAREVMRLLDEYGERVVGHLIDTDDNPGQRLREALNEHV